MSQRNVVVGILLVAVAGAVPCPRAAGDDPKPSTPSASDLAVEVAALRTLYGLKTTPEQMQLLKKLAPRTMEKARARKGTASKEYAEQLTELRNALVDASDDDRIGDAEDTLDQLHESEKPDLDDGVEVTAAARQQVPELLRQLKASQLANYLGQVADDVADPLDRLTESLAKVRGLKGEEWKEKRDEVADEVARLVAGLDEDRAGKVNDAVVTLLTAAHGLADEEFKAQRPQLEEKARRIAGDVGPTEVLRHTVEHALAELLSNPRLTAAVEARLK
jgi:hypothetical protein